jgi:hypothetical protein
MKVLVALLLLLAVASPTPAHAQSPGWLPPVRIAVVWPHDEQGKPVPVEQARAVNVSVWPTNAVPCAQVPNPAVLTPRLMVAQGNEPARFVESPSRLARRTVGQVPFPSLEWDDLPTDPAGSYRFVVYALGVPIGGNFYSNVWAHAADARTVLPQPFLPEDVAANVVPPEGVDARIQVVWPHDQRGQLAPPERAAFVNVAVDLFQHATRRSLPVEAARQYAVRLLVAEGNGALVAAETAKGGTTTYQLGGKSYPRWTFDDVPVKPGVLHSFVVSSLAAGGKLASPYSTVWTHAADPRTIQPDPQPPPACIS